MRETIEDLANQIFFDICEKEQTDIDIFFLDNINFPKIDYLPRMTVYVPVPRELNGNSIYEGNIFSNYESGKETIWNLFFATICHAAGHAKVTDFNKYTNWIKGKDKKKAYKVIEIIEDVKVNDYLEKSFPEYYQEINKINQTYKMINEKNERKNKTYAKKIFSEKFTNKTLTWEKIKKDILNSDSTKEKLIEIADLMYNNENLRIEEKIPYVDHHFMPKKISNWHQNIKINPKGIVQKNVENFIETWFTQLKHKAKMYKKYQEMTADLNFDKIEFAPENMGEYLRLKNAAHVFLKKMSREIKMVPNIMDEGKPEDMGLLEMQAAIQAMASQNTSIQIFEQDDVRRTEEAWAIILDTSSSMRLKFEEMKKFAVVLGEAANEVNSKNGKWGFFTFNNDFTIVKDNQEKYDQTIKSRVGGITVSGLSFVGDAVKLCSRVLAKENIEKKYIFLVTDGQQVGTLGNNKDMEKAVMEARKAGISVIGIGFTQGKTKVFNLCLPYENLRKTTAKFIAAYSRIAGDDM
ncbi:MAG: VWA domain-containing protein [Nitrosarchaeum sp.]